MQDYCDWCYGTLTDQDRAEYFNQFLNQVDAYACSSCIRGARVLDPPDSLEVPDTLPPDAWRTAAVAIFDQDSNGYALELLRKAAGFLSSESGPLPDQPAFRGTQRFAQDHWLKTERLNGRGL